MIAFAKDPSGHPIRCKDVDEWQEEVRQLAHWFENYYSDNTLKKQVANSYWEELYKAIPDTEKRVFHVDEYTEEQKVLNRKWLDAERAADEFAMNSLKRGFTELSKIVGDLWD